MLHLKCLLSKTLCIKENIISCIFIASIFFFYIIFYLNILYNLSDYNFKSVNILSFMPMQSSGNKWKLHWHETVTPSSNIQFKITITLTLNTSVLSSFIHIKQLYTKFIYNLRYIVTYFLTYNFSLRHNYITSVLKLFCCCILLCVRRVSSFAFILFAYGIVLQ